MSDKKRRSEDLAQYHKRMLGKHKVMSLLVPKKEKKRYSEGRKLSFQKKAHLIDPKFIAKNWIKCKNRAINFGK